MSLQLAIEKLGLNPKQASVYFSLLQLGSGSVIEISKITTEKRTTIYSILDILIQKGFVSLIKKGAHRKYFAEDPKKILYLYDEEIVKINEKKRSVLDILPELSSIYNVSSIKPKVKFYEGIEGLKLVFNETLNLKRGDEILAYSSAESIHKYFGDEYVKNYLANRVSKGITQRAIVEYSPEALGHKTNDAKESRRTFLVDKEKFPFSNEINIFENKILILSYKDFLGVLIESSEIAKTQRAIFELAWLGASGLSLNK
jgi:sugar-specific transcriptional regulator TrmB